MRKILVFLLGMVSALAVAVAIGYFAMQASGIRGGAIVGLDGVPNEAVDPSMPILQFLATAAVGLLFLIPVLLNSTSRSTLLGELAGGVVLVIVASMLFSPRFEYGQVWLRWLVEGSVSPVFFTLLAVIAFRLVVSWRSEKRALRTEQAESPADRLVSQRES
jgi:hypothetical protein